MFKHILVPLDGSKLAEAAIPAAASLSIIFRAPVTLLHVIERDAPETIHHDRHLSNPEKANEYLAEVAKTAFSSEIKVDWHVHTAAVADVARSIVEHSAEEFQPDLIILCSHGNSGVHEVLYGNIAQQVAAASGTPVLLIKPDGKGVFNPKHILIPLDNESIHDDVIPVAMDLARAYNAELNLICVIATLATLTGEQAAAGTLMPVTANAYLNMTEQNASEHLEGHLRAFQKEKIPSTAEIARGDPAPVIAKFADENGSDLIVFGTHGRAGLDAFWNRSVAAGVARRTTIPVLLVPLGQASGPA